MTRSIWRRARAVVLAATVLFSLVSVLVLAHSNAILPLAWETLPIMTIEARPGGRAYTAPNPGGWMSEDRLVAASLAQLLEDGRPLGPGGVQSRAVDELGGGRYALRGEQIFFSTPDGSDPRANGREYAIHWPVKISRSARHAVYGLAGLSLLACLILWWRALVRLIVAPWRFAFPATIVILPFLLTRLPFFLYYPVPSVAPDSSTYVAIAMKIMAGNWPMLGVRPPGYPLLLATTWSVWDSLMAIVVVQNVLALSALLFAVWAVHRVDRRFSVTAAVGMAAFGTAAGHLTDTVYLLSESLYSSSMLVALAALIPGILERNPRFLATASAFMAVVIFVRPIGIVLFVTWGMVLCFILWNRFSRRSLAAFFFPFAMLTLGLSGYNYATLGVFSTTAWAETNLLGAVAPMVEEHEKFSPEINAGIRRLRALVTDEDRAVMDSSWDPTELSRTFEKHYGASRAKRILGIKGGFVPNSDLFLEIATVAISEHPDWYLKFVYSQLWKYFYRNISLDHNFYGNLRKRYQRMFVNKDMMPNESEAYRRTMLKEYLDAPPLQHFVADKEVGTARIVVTIPLALHGAYSAVHRVVFRNKLWVLVFLAAFGLSGWITLRSLGRNATAFTVFAITSAGIGTGLAVSIVELGLFRYSFPVEFIHYLSPTFLLMLLWGQRGSEGIKYNVERAVDARSGTQGPKKHDHSGAEGSN